MKKILICLLLFITTGCMDTNYDFSKTCIKNVKSNDYNEKIKMQVNYNNENKVTKVVMEKTYIINDTDVLNSIKISTENYNKKLKNEKGIEFKMEEYEEKYKVIYTLLPLEMSETNLKRFDIKTNSVKYFKQLQKNNYECSKK